MKNRIINLFIVILLIGLSFTNCDENIPKFDTVRVEKVEWSEYLKNGVSIELGIDTFEVANRMEVYPIEATNKMQSFSSSNAEIAVVDAAGMVTTNGVGSTTITVTIDEKTDDFVLTVKDRDQIRVTDIILTAEEINTMTGLTTDLSIMTAVLPDNAVDKTLVYQSDNEQIAVVDQNGKMKALTVGTTNIVISSRDVPEIKKEIRVIVEEFQGDYPRNEWTLTASQDPLFDEFPNSVTSPLDGDFNTWMGLVKPGKSHNGITIPPTSQGGEVYFIIDMKEQLVVNYFRIRHRNDDVLLRYYMMGEVSGSNDGVNFTVIATDITITGHDLKDVLESPNFAIPESKYRYLKFACRDNKCFNPGGDRGSVQLSEIYIGWEK